MPSRRSGPIGHREPLQDIARNLDRWTHAIVARTFKQETIDALAQWASVPVINALSDKYHPCQALADMQTLRERFSNLRTAKLAFVGDGNNVAHSLMLCTARLGIDFRIATPVDYGPDPAVVAQAQTLAAESGSSITLTNGRSKLSPGRTRSIPTSGPAWDRNRKPLSEALFSTLIR